MQLPHNHKLQGTNCPFFDLFRHTFICRINFFRLNVCRKWVVACGKQLKSSKIPIWIDRLKYVGDWYLAFVDNQIRITENRLANTWASVLVS